MTKRPPYDISIDGDRVYCTGTFVLTRERGKWCGVETVDGHVIGTIFHSRMPKSVLDAVAEAERPWSEDDAGDEALERKRTRGV